MPSRLAAFLLVALPALAQPARIAFDPRIELLSIVFHLAGNPEYNQCKVTVYCESVDKYFAPFKDHEATRLARELNEKSGINYDAVMSMAIHIKDVETMAERIPFDAPDSRLEKRWRPRDARRFLAALRQFVEHSHFRQFLDANAALYETTTTRLRSLVESQADLAWFDKFFGAKAGARFIIGPGMINGGGNYGPSLRAEDGREEMYAILGVWQVDADKQPSFDKQSYVPTLVHEFAHSYVNPLVDRFQALDKAGDAVYALVSSQMQSQAYANGHTLICESVVRASTARYVLLHGGADQARYQVEGEQRRSFLWTNELFQLLAGYEADRERYPGLETFMPKVVAYFETLALRITSLVQEYDAKRPRLVSISPANGTQDVDPSLTTIVLKFNRPLRAGYSFCRTVEGDAFPKVGKSVYDETRTTFQMEVQLEPNRDYGMRVNCNGSFMNDDGIPVKETVVKFHTRQ